MTPESIIALIGVTLTVLGAILTVYIKLDGRVGRIETIIEIVGVETLKNLHSDDNHLGLDEYIDKIEANYYEHHYDLTDEEWADFQQRLSEVKSNPLATNLEKAQARMILRLCEHKMMRSLKIKKA